MKSLAELGSEADAIRRDLAMLHAKHAVAADTLRKLDEDIAAKQSEAQAIQERVADAFDAIQGMGAQKVEAQNNMQNPHVDPDMTRTKRAVPWELPADTTARERYNGAETPQF